jgi:hypothetical protein
MRLAQEALQKHIKVAQRFAKDHPFPERLWKRPVVEIRSTLGPWRDQLARAVEAVALPWCSRDVSLEHCLAAERSFRSAKRLESQIEEDPSLAPLLADWWRRSDTRADALRAASKWIEHAAQAPGMSLALVRSLFADSTAIDRQGLAQVIGACRSFSQAIERHLAMLGEAGTLDHAAWTEWHESVATYSARLQDCTATIADLPIVARVASLRARVETDGLGALASAAAAGKISGRQCAAAYEFSIYTHAWRSAVANEPLLAGFGRASFERLQEDFRKLDRQMLAAHAAEIAAELARRPIPEGKSRGRVSEYTELGLLRHEIGKKRHLPIRQIAARAPNTLQAIKPCFLMSPLSVAQFLAPGEIEFDLVVMDEASQIRPEDALGALERGRCAVIVGDPNHLPPTRFFDSGVADDHDDGVETTADDTESVLDLALKQLPRRRLRWHYRSEHEALIQFSNERFYDNDLIVFPSPKAGLREGGVHSNFVASYSYRKGRNPDEARAVVQAIAAHYRATPGLSLGVAAFNKVQADEITLLLDRARQQDPALDERIRRAHLREPLFIKNLENVQGDERDVIMISTTYGPEREGVRPFQRFGPVGWESGWRRLNVIATRAKKRVEVFTSMQPTDVLVGDAPPRGVRELRAYLEYAATASAGTRRLRRTRPSSRRRYRRRSSATG